MSDLKFSTCPSDDVTPSAGPPRQRRSRHWANIGIGLSLALVLIVLTLIGMTSASQAAPPTAPFLNIDLYRIAEESVTPRTNVPIAPNQLITYVYMVDNRSDEVAGLTFTDTLPDNLLFVSADPAPSGSNGQVYTWMDTLPASGDNDWYVTITARLSPTQNVLHDEINNYVEAWLSGAGGTDYDDHLTSHDVVNAEIVKEAATAWNYGSGYNWANDEDEAVPGEQITFTVFFTVPQGTIAYTATPRILVEDGLWPTGAEPNWMGDPITDQEAVDPEARFRTCFTQLDFAPQGSITGTDAGPYVFSYTVYAHPRQYYFLSGDDCDTGEEASGGHMIQPMLRWCGGLGCTVTETNDIYFADNVATNDVYIIRPDVRPTIDHSYLDAAGIGQGGEEVRFDINIRNQSGAPHAYSMVLTATLEEGLTYSDSGPTADNVQTQGDQTYITWNVPVTLPASAEWNAAVTATLPSTFVIGTQFTVTADVHHESFPGDVEDEGAYVGSASHSILPGLSHVKYAWPDDDETIGGTAFYTVVTTIGQDTLLYDPHYTDTLPPGFHYLPGTFDLSPGSLLASGPSVVAGATQPGQEDLVWYMNDLDLRGESTQLITATYQAELSGLDTDGQAVYASSESDIRYPESAENSAVLYWLAIQGDPDSAMSSAPAMDGVDVAQPFLRNSSFKTMRIDSPYGDKEVGEFVNFRILFRNTSNGDVSAYDVHVCDELPPGFAYESRLAWTPPAACNTAILVSEPSPGDEGTVCFIVDEVCKISSDFQIDYRVQVLPSATPGVPLTNTAIIADYSSQPGGTNDGDADDDDLPPGVNFDRHYMDFASIALPDPKYCSDDDGPGCPFYVLGLKATKTAVQSSVAPGQQINYTIDYENTSSSQSYSDVVISDTYDSNLAYVSATPSPASHDPAQRLLVWNVDPVALGGSGQIQVTMQVTTALFGAKVVTNSIKWAASDGSQTVTPGPVVASTPVDAANLHLQMGGPGVAHAGQSISYTVVYSNDGTMEATPVTITLDYGPYLTFDSATLEGSPISPEAGSDDQVFIDSTSLPADGSPHTLVLWLTVDAPLPYSLVQIDSSATVQCPTTPPVGDDVTVVLERPVFDFDKTGPELAPTEGGLIQYRFQLVNTGDLTATGCIISDTWDEATILNETGSTGWAPDVSDEYATFTLPPLAPDASASVNDLFVNVDTEKDKYINRATLNCDQTTAVKIVEETWAASIATAKSATPDPAFPGRTLTYTIYYTNTGAAVVHAVITDTLPDGFGYQGPPMGAVSGQGCLPPGWQFQGVTGQDAVWTCDTLVDSAAGQLQFWGTVTTNPAYEGTWLVNATLASGDDIAPRPIAEPLRTRIARPWLGIAKNDGGNSPVAPGDTLTYTLVYSNYGTDAAEDVVITDPLPDQVTFVGCDPDCSHDSGVVTWNPATAGTLVLGVVPTDTVASLTLVVQVSAGTEGQTIVNDNYTIQSRLLEPISGPALETPILAPHLDLTKMATPDVMNTVGTLITYTIGYANDGGGPLTNVVITDELSTSIGFRNASAQCEHSGGLVGGVVTCDIGGLSQKQSGIVEILVESTAAQDIANLAQGDSDQTDPTTSLTATVWYDTDGCYEVREVRLDYDSPVNTGQSVDFAASAFPMLAHTPITYTWNFGDDTSPQQTNVPTITHVFAEPDTYQITLDVDNICVQGPVQFQGDIVVQGEAQDFYLYLPLVLKAMQP